MRSFPRIKVDLDKFKENLNNIQEICKSHDSNLAFVIKGCNGFPEVAKVAEQEGVNIIASSRLEQLKNLKENFIKSELMLIRIPGLTEVSDVIKYCEISLNSELEVLKALNYEAAKENKIHQVILMVDLGDLREGFWNDEELLAVTKEIETNLTNLDLVGIGTNLGCYGALAVTEDKMVDLVNKAELVENVIGRRLKYISGGGTTAIPRILDNTMPKRVNLLRVGEAILIANDLTEVWKVDMPKMHRDVITIEAEVVEVKIKPTYPIGEIVSDGFGNTPIYEDRGIRNRAILAIGKIDYAFPEELIPTLEGVSVIGASSDHTMIDIEDAKVDIKVGDIIEFQLSYANMAFATHSTDLHKYFK